MRSWPEPKSDAQPTEPPRRPWNTFHVCGCTHSAVSETPPTSCTQANLQIRSGPQEETGFVQDTYYAGKGASQPYGLGGSMGYKMSSWCKRDISGAGLSDRCNCSQVLGGIANTASSFWWQQNVLGLLFTRLFIYVVCGFNSRRLSSSLFSSPLNGFLYNKWLSAHQPESLLLLTSNLLFLSSNLLFILFVHIHLCTCVQVNLWHKVLKMEMLWKSIFAKDMSDKGILSKAYKELSFFNVCLFIF